MKNKNIVDNTVKDLTPKITQQLLGNLVKIGWTENMIDDFLIIAIVDGDIYRYKTMLLNKEWNQAIWNPLRKHPKEELSYTTDEDNWNELTYKEREERLNGTDIITPGFVDLNKANFDELVDNLEKDIMFRSDPEAYIIGRLIEFYKQNKEK